MCVSWQDTWRGGGMLELVSMYIVQYMGRGGIVLSVYTTVFQCRPINTLSPLQGTVSRDYLLQVYFIYHLPPLAPASFLRAISIFLKIRYEVHRQRRWHRNIFANFRNIYEKSSPVESGDRRMIIYETILKWKFSWHCTYKRTNVRTENIKFSSYTRKFRMEQLQLQGHIWLTAFAYMGKYLRISSLIRKPFLLYDFATAPLWNSLYMRKIWYSFLSV